MMILQLYTILMCFNKSLAQTNPRQHRNRNSNSMITRISQLKHRQPPQKRPTKTAPTILQDSPKPFVLNFSSSLKLRGKKSIKRNPPKKPVVAPYTISQFVLKRVESCSERWEVKPMEPSYWKNNFPAKEYCSQKRHHNPISGSEDDVCRLNRFVNFPQCNISVIIPHKSASSMIMAQFENICGFPEFKSSEHSGFKSNSFLFDHNQDHFQTQDASFKQEESNSRKLQMQFVDGERVESHYTVAILRDPIDRAVGMYNMMAGSDANYGHSQHMFTDEEILKIQNNWARPTQMLIQWRFSRFLAYLQTSPILAGNFVHFSSQSRYLGVGCNYTLLKPDLIGRSEKLPQLFSMIAAEEPLFKAAYEVYIDKGGNIPPWYFRMHDARGDWSMTPCDVNAQLYEQIKGAFEDDFNCFGQDVLTNTKLVFT